MAKQHYTIRVESDVLDGLRDEAAQRGLTMQALIDEKLAGGVYKETLGEILSLLKNPRRVRKSRRATKQ